jgi:hypothetical protein
VKVVCIDCGATETLAPERPICGCGGAWDVPERTDFDPSLIDPADHSVWRYRRLYGLDVNTPTTSLGAGARRWSR